jgi:hypothetical protein
MLCWNLPKGRLAPQRRDTLSVPEDFAAVRRSFVPPAPTTSGRHAVGCAQRSVAALCRFVSFLSWTTALAMK